MNYIHYLYKVIKGIISQTRLLLILQVEESTLFFDFYKIKGSYSLFKNLFAPVLDEVLLEPAGDLLVGEGGDGDHSPELAGEPLMQPVELLVAPAHLQAAIKVLLFIAPLG